MRNNTYTIHFLLPFLVLLYGQVEGGRYIISAATSGFGVAISDLLARQGHSLILSGRNVQALEALKEKLEDSYKVQCVVECFDYIDVTSIQRLGDRLKDQAIDGLVIIPARFTTLSTSGMLSCDEWRSMFDVGFIAPMELIRQLLPTLRRESSIVVIDGVTSACYIPEYKNLNVLRKMWIGQMKNLVYQLGDRAIRVNAVSPGVILTEYHMRNIEKRAIKAHKSIEEQLASETKDIPLHRHGKPADIAHAVAYLLSQESSHVNGVNLVIDGGLSKAY